MDTKLVGGCEYCYTTIPLIEYASLFLREDDIKFAKAQLAKNQGKLSLVQKQLDPEKVMMRLKRDNDFNISDVEDSDLEDIDQVQQFGINQMGGIDIKEFWNADFNYKNDDISSSSDESADLQDIKIQVKEEERKVQVRESKMQVKQKNEIGEQNVDLEGIVEIQCHRADKVLEEEQRREKLDHLNDRLQDLALRIEQTKNEEKQNVMRDEIIHLRDKITELNEERINENKFWGYVAGDENEFQFGRENLKEGTFEQYLCLPYSKFPMLMNPYWTGNKTAQVGGLLRSGIITGANLKAQINMYEVDEDSYDSEDDDDCESVQPQNQNYGQTPGGPDDQTESNENNEDSQEDLDNEEKEMLILKDTIARFPYDLANENFIKAKLFPDNPLVKVRVYLLTCQNLAAVGSAVEWKPKLAGLDALSSANPYPIIIVGEGTNDINEQQLKMITDRDKEVKNSLNPQFFRTYEFDIQFAEDWKLELQIYDKKTLSYFDELIGSTTIDLEDRFNGNLRKTCLESLEIHRKLVETEKKKEEKKEKPDPRNLKRYNWLLEQIRRSKTDIQLVEPKPIPIEYRELRHPNKLQPQGNVEMWVEVLTVEEARRQPLVRLHKISKELYEIRLIIWELRDVPLINASSVDVYVRVMFDPSGWSGSEITKDTDVHYSSTDGRALYNYRLKFNIETPCEFPRLKFQIKDFNLVSGDESIGETTLNLKKTLAILSKEGRLDLQKQWLPFTHPIRKDERRGEALISMQIISKQEADQNPVGEAQDEPNENPKLVTPTVGRGFGARMQAVTGLDVSKFKLPKFNFMRNLIILGVIGGIGAIILFAVMYFTK